MAENAKTAFAVAKYQRVSPRKTRLVARNVVGLEVSKAQDILRFIPNKAAKIIAEVIRSASSNATNNKYYDPDLLWVKEIQVNEGPSWKRFMPRAQGRASKIHKRTSHITVIVVEEQERKED